MDPWEDFVVKVLELLKTDEELHAAALRVLGAHAEFDMARADHERALAERARK